MPARHCSRGLSMTVVSYMSSGALSVGLSERPTTPKTLSTSGKDLMMRSCSWSNVEACVIEIPGRAVGMYNDEPSYSGGMNWLPMRHASGSVTTKKIKLRSRVVFRYRRHKRRTGRYKACVQRENGFVDSDLRWPRMNITIRTGTRVMARIDENATERVLVHARGRNMRPSCASNRNTGRKDTRITSNEKKMAGPTCFAAPIRMRRLSFSVSEAADGPNAAMCSDKWR